MNKKTINILMILLPLMSWAFYCFSIASELGPEGIRNYVENALELLLGIHNRVDPYARKDISTIKERIITASIKQTLWERIFSLRVERTVDEVRENIFSGIIDFVENQSYRYAYEKTRNITIATKVAKNMSNSIADRIIQSGEFKPGALSWFVGQSLYKAVMEQCNRFDTVYDTIREEIIKCRICYEKDVKSNCVALSPCSHWICKQCAHDYFFIQQKNSRCPQCGRPIDLNNLYGKLYTPSAPPLD